MVQQRRDLRLLHRVGLHHHALVEGAVGDDVAVALQQLHQPVRDGVRGSKPGAEAVGDRHDQPRLVFPELVRIGRDPFARHQHRLVGGPAPRLDPGQRHLRRPGAAGGQAEGQRVDHAARTARARQLGVGGDDARRLLHPSTDMHLLAQLAERADRGLLFGEAVAVADGRRLVRQHEVGLGDGDADAVQRVDAEDGDVRVARHGRAEGVRHLRASAARSALFIARSSFAVRPSGCGARRAARAAGRPARRARSSRVTPGACSKGVQTVSKSSGSDHLAVAADFGRRQRDGFVEGLVGGDGEAVAGLVLVHLEGIAAEQDAPAHRRAAPLGLRSGRRHGAASGRAQLQRVVVGPGDAEGLGERRSSFWIASTSGPNASCNCHSAP